MTEAELLAMNARDAAKFITEQDHHVAERLLALYVRAYGRQIVGELEAVGIDVVPNSLGAEARETASDPPGDGTPPFSVSSQKVDVADTNGGEDAAQKSDNQKLYDSPNVISNRLVGIGMLLIIASVIVIVIALIYDVGVDVSDLGSDISRVANTDRIAIREMILLIGGFCFIGGSVFLSSGMLTRALIGSGERRSA